MKLFQATSFIFALILQHGAFASNQDGERKLIVTDIENSIPGQYIVTLKPNLVSSQDVGTLEMIAETLVAGSHATVTAVYESAIQGFVATGMSEDEAAALADNDDVMLVEQDATVQLEAFSPWGLDRIDDRDLPLDESYTPAFGNEGTGVTAYIIDTGILHTHTDFGGRATQEFNSVSGSPNTDCNGHGTHVAGTVGGSEYGVAKNVKLVGVKVLSCTGGGTWSGVIQGINWVAANAKKPATANMSLGGGSSPSLNSAVQGLVATGVSTVVAAGNSNRDACLYSPAGEPTAITVGSTDSNDGRSYFSNYGTCLDIFAPGRNIKSAWIGSNTATNTISGTSMASPHVCGAAALHLGKNPTLTPTQIAFKLTSTSTPGKVTNEGTGSPNRLVYVGASDDDDDDDDEKYLRIAVGVASRPHRILVNHDNFSQEKWNAGQSMTTAGWKHKQEFWVFKERQPGTIRIAVGQAWNPHRMMVNHDNHSQEEWDNGKSMTTAGWKHKQEFWAFEERQPGTIRIVVGQAWNPHRVMFNHDYYTQAQWDNGQSMGVFGWKHKQDFWVYAHNPNF